MSLEENKNIVRRYQEIYNSNDLDALSDVVSDDFLTPKIMPGFGRWFGGRQEGPHDHLDRHARLAHEDRRYDRRRR